MTDPDKIYEKLIEVAENVSSLRATYEEGKSHAIDTAKKNGEEHERIFEALEKKVDRSEISFFIWAQQNPRFVIWSCIIMGAGLVALNVDRNVIQREILRAVSK